MNSAIICGFLDREPELEYENKRGGICLVCRDNVFSPSTAICLCL